MMEGTGAGGDAGRFVLTSGAVGLGARGLEVGLGVFVLAWMALLAPVDMMVLGLGLRLGALGLMVVDRCHVAFLDLI